MAKLMDQVGVLGTHRRWLPALGTTAAENRPAAGEASISG